LKIMLKTIFTEEKIEKIRGSLKEDNHFFEKRKLSLDSFYSYPLPSNKSEEWRYTDISFLDFSKFDNDIKNPEIKMDGFHDLLKEKGVIFTTIIEAISKHPEIIKEYLFSKKDNYEDKFLALHKAMWNGGVFIYVPKNVEVDTIFKVKYNVLESSSLFNHTLIILEQGASLTYSEEHTSEKGDYEAFRCDSVEVYAKENSKLNFNNFQNWNDNITNVSYWSARVSRDAQVNWRFSQLGGKFSRIKIDTHLDGEGSNSTNKGLVYANKNQKFDITTNPHHHVRNTISDVLVKGAFDGESNSVYRGLILIDEEGKETQSYLSNHSLMLSENAVSNTIPSLKIETDDVRASHGATLGKIDKDHLFYLKTRGIDQKSGERLLITAFLKETIDDMKDVELKEKIILEIEKKTEK